MARSFASPGWAACSLILILSTAAPGNVQGDCSAGSICGKLTIKEPFGIIPEQATETNCGLIGFPVSCQNNTPYLGYYRRSNESYDLQILDIFYGNGSLLVVDTQKLGDLANLTHKDCEQYKFPTANTSSKIAQPFWISHTNQELILYSCTKAQAAAEGLLKRRCGDNTFIARVGGNYSDLHNSDGYFLEGCDAIVVPMLKKSGKENASNYEELISNGFLLTWSQPPGKLILETNKISLVE